MLIKTALGTLVVFLASSIWLYLAWSHGNRTKQWTVVPAVVIKIDTDPPSERRTGRRRGAHGWKTTVKYVVNGAEYQAVVDEYLVGSNEVVYVDPEDPNSVVGKAGPAIQDMFAPIIVTAGSGLFAVVLLLIAVSPKGD